MGSKQAVEVEKADDVCGSSCQAQNKRQRPHHGTGFRGPCARPYSCCHRSHQNGFSSISLDASSTAAVGRAVVASDTSKLSCVVTSRLSACKTGPVFSAELDKAAPACIAPQ